MCVKYLYGQDLKRVDMIPLEPPTSVPRLCQDCAQIVPRLSVCVEGGLSWTVEIQNKQTDCNADTIRLNQQTLDMDGSSNVDISLYHV